METLKLTLAKDYLNAFVEYNQNSIFNIEQSNTEFVRLFFFPYPCINAVPHLRPLFIMYGTHIKSKYHGILLLFVSRDALNNIIILCFACVPVENEDNWTWFIQNIRNALPNYDFSSSAIICDRDKGAVPAVSSVLGCAHYFCSWHIAENIRTRVSSSQELRNLFFACSHSMSIEELNENLEKIKILHEGLFNYLNRLDPVKWTLIDTKRVGETTSNVAESLNSVILPLRKLQFLGMIKGLVKLMNDWFFGENFFGAKFQFRLPFGFGT